MIKSGDIVAKVSNAQNQLEHNEVIRNIRLIQKRIEEKVANEWEIDALVDTVFSLVKIMNNLSKLKDSAYLEAESMEAEYKSAKRDKYISLKNGEEKITDSMANMLAERDCESIELDWKVASAIARTLKSLYEDIERLVNFTQTKIKSHVDDRIRSNIGN
jgi:acetolactate synthase regulatory subunit